MDDTLTNRSCLEPFLRRLGGRHGLVLAVARRPVATTVALARRDRDGMKEIVVGGVLDGRSVADVDEKGIAFADHVRRTWIRADTLQRLRWHQRSGHRTVLVSASLGPYLRPLGKLLGVEGVLCADIAVGPRQAGGDESERYGDRLLGRNCRGPEKVRRLEVWMAELGLREAQVWAYGDSRGDRELLARADHPVLVGDAPVPCVPEGWAC